MIVEIAQIAAKWILIAVVLALAVVWYMSPPKSIGQAGREIVGMGWGILKSFSVVAVLTMLVIGMEIMFTTYAWAVFEVAVVVGLLGWVAWATIRGRSRGRKPRD